MRKSFYLKILLSAVLLISIPYCFALVKKPFWFIVSVPAVLAALLFVAGLFLSQFVYDFLPGGLQRIHDQQQFRYRAIIFLGLLLTIAGWFFAFEFFPSPARWIVIFVVFIYAVILEWRLVLIKQKGWLWPATGILIVFLNIQSFLTPHNSRASFEDSKEQLRSIPYFTWVPATKDPEKSGVTLNIKEKSSPGFNLYNSRNLAKAELTDTDGNVIHAWSDENGPDSTWSHVEPAHNGDLFAINDERRLLKVKLDSTIEWSHYARHHHDIAITENKEIHALTRKDDIVFYHGIPLPVLNDYITVLGPDGKMRSETSVYDIFKDHITFRSVKKIYRWIFNRRVFVFIMKGQLGTKKHRFLFWEDTPMDILHANAIELTDRSIAGFCNKEDWLISIRQLDLICMVNSKTAKVTWVWGSKELSKQHNPTLLTNGNILIFDNGVRMGYSRIVELDPLQKKIVWEYKANPPEHFYSRSRGGAQRLANGNTLITESDRGHVFEVTPGGSVVWEFYNPQKSKDDKFRAAIYRMKRIPLTPDELKMYSQSPPESN